MKLLTYKLDSGDIQDGVDTYRRRIYILCTIKQIGCVYKGPVIEIFYSLQKVTAKNHKAFQNVIAQPCSQAPQSLFGNKASHCLCSYVSNSSASHALHFFPHFLLLQGVKFSIHVVAHHQSSIHTVPSIQEDTQRKFSHKYLGRFFFFCS